MSNVTLTNDQLSQLDDIYSTQSALPPQEQNWAGAYAIIGSAIQDADVSDGVKFFFNNAGAVNGNDGDSAAAFYIRSYYTSAAALQGVTLSTSQVQAVSGKIGAAVINHVLTDGTVADTAIPYIQNDIPNAVANIPGVTQTLSPATWGGALFADSKLGYENFGADNFKSAEDWAIFYGAAQQACIATGENYGFGGDVSNGLACVGLFGAATNYYQMQEAQGVNQAIQWLANAAKSAFDALSNLVFTPAHGAENLDSDLKTLNAFGDSSHTDSNTTVEVQTSDGTSGTLSIALDGTTSLVFGDSTVSFGADRPVDIQQSADNGGALSLVCSAPDFDQALTITTDGIAIAMNGDSISSVPAGSQVELESNNAVNVTQFDVEDSQTWSEQSDLYNAVGDTSVVKTIYDDGSVLVTGLNDDGSTSWTESVATDGTLSYSGAGNATVETGDGTVVAGYVPDGTPDIQYVPDGGADTQMRMWAGSGGDTEASLNGGTAFDIPADSDTALDVTGFTSTYGGGGAPYGFDPPPAPGDPDDSEPPFEPDHPSPLDKRDPLIVDLDGDGIALTDVHGSTTHFDYGGTGFAPATGWVDPSDGVLVHDVVDGSVTADNLFGATSGDGFTDLSSFDSNNDGKIDSSDADFDDLRIWQDANSNGAADSGELLSLADAGITAINLNATPSGENVEGNVIVQTATFVRTDETTGTIAEVNFATDALLSRYTPPEGFTYSQTAFLLPALVGYGNLPDIIYSMSLDSNLEDAARDLVTGANSMTGSEFTAEFQNLVMQWAGVADVDPDSQGPLIDARHMALVEAVYGTTYEQANGEGATLNPYTANGIEATYQAIIDEMQLRFVAQLPLSQLVNGASWSDIESSPFLPFASIKFDHNADTVTVDFNKLVADVGAAAPSDAVDQVGYYDLMARLIKSTRVDLFGEDVAALATAFTTAAVAGGIDSAAQAQVLAEFNADHIIDTRDAGSTVDGTSGADVILADDQDHTLSGGAGADTYVYAKDGGTITIDDASFSSGDKLVLVGAAHTDATLSRDGGSDDLSIAITGGNTISVSGQFESVSGAGLENVTFADGTTWTAAEIKQMLLNQESAASSGSVYGYSGSDDTLVAGLGGKTLVGLSGNDTYVYAAGDGNVTVNDGSFSSADVLTFSDVMSGDVTLSRDADSQDVVLTIAGGGSVTLTDQFGSVAGAGIETVQFSDSVNWTASDIKQMLLDAESAASSGTVYGYSGSDDTLVAGDGGKTLVGLSGDDTYVYASGNGDVTVNDGSFSGGDVLSFSDINLADVTLTQNAGSNDLLISISGGGSVTVADQFSGVGNAGVETISFADGSSLDAEQVAEIVGNAPPGATTVLGTNSAETLDGTSGADIIDGMGGADLLRGGAGDDVYLERAGSGNDVIYDSGDSGDTNTLRLIGIDPTDVTLTHSGDYDLIITRSDTGEAITVQDQFLSSHYGLENIQFDDSTTWDRSTISANAVFVGTSGAETINGTSDGDIIDGLAGDDLLKGGDGSDTYLERAGSGNDTIYDQGSSGDTDTLKLMGVAVADVSLSHSGDYDMVVTRADTGESITVQDQFLGSSYGLEQIKFDDGTIWDRSTLAANTAYLGTSGADTINGTSDADTIDGLAGNDLLKGSGGSDTYLERAGSGDDTIYDFGSSGDTDTLKLIGVDAADVTLSHSGDYDMLVTRADTGETITIQDQFLSSSYGLEQIKFDDGTTWDRSTIAADAAYLGTSGVDTINGTSDPDTIDGLAGDDLLKGSGGGDTYVERAGSGNDTIYDFGSSGDVDTLKLEGVDPADVVLTQSGDWDLMIHRTDTGETITDQYQFLSGSYGIDQIKFDDGTTWDKTALQSNIGNWVQGTSGNDTLSGTSHSDVLNGLAGDDTITTGAGNDVIVFNPGFGHDTVTDFTPGSDVAEFHGAFSSFAAVQAASAQVGSDTVITVDASNSVTLHNVALTNLHSDDFRYV